ncbi:MAG TPA: superoxide dismutase [Candidatus Pacearchaeota archaeon]|nr:superoxide dismutase [Candidatus Pacearchaeota archaeon]
MLNTLPELKYSFDALEPFIDAKTMEIHHDKHHQGYVDKLNKALEGTGLEDKSAEELLKDINGLPEDKKQAIINNAGGHANHSFFWNILKKDVKPSGEIKDAIHEKFGSGEDFKEKFKEAAITLFGSGWVWLVLNNNELEIIQTKNQDSPLSVNKIPLLGIDLWEHAYYLKYQNKRPDYVDAFFNVINWGAVNENFLKAAK